MLNTKPKVSNGSGCKDDFETNLLAVHETLFSLPYRHHLIQLSSIKSGLLIYKSLCRPSIPEKCSTIAVTTAFK